MKVIYIAGKFRGANAWEVEQNIREAEAMAFNVANLGASFICPHTNTRFFDGTINDEFWLDATMELLRRCDAVMLVDNWQDSRGAQAEVAEAQRLQMPVFDYLPELAKFLDS